MQVDNQKCLYIGQLRHGSLEYLLAHALPVLKRYSGRCGSESERIAGKQQKIIKTDQN